MALVTIALTYTVARPGGVQEILRMAMTVSVLALDWMIAGYISEQRKNGLRNRASSPDRGVGTRTTASAPALLWRTLTTSPRYGLVERQARLTGRWTTSRRTHRRAPTSARYGLRGVLEVVDLSVVVWEQHIVAIDDGDQRGVACHRCCRQNTPWRTLPAKRRTARAASRWRSVGSMHVLSRRQ